jgi:Fe(3+) dicitrate transport protein
MKFIKDISLQVFLIAINSLCFLLTTGAQTKDTAVIINLNEVKVIGYKAMNGIGHFNEVNGQVIYAGKKTEMIEVDSIDANKAINSTRQILGRIPGLNIVESETGGFVANGIGVRGLNPVQSLEIDVRQNGYNVAADVYGYNETYYLPPMEAVARVEVIKGAATIQYGPQLGGMVNYVIKEGSKEKPFDYSTMQTAGSNGLFNSYHAFGGRYKKLNYFTFLNFRTLDGWRQNSQQRQLTGYGKISYQLNEKISLGLEYSLLRNKIQMPGGLTDDQFETDYKASVRSRNWLKSPWNVLSASFNYNIRQHTSLQVRSTFLSGERSLVWINKLPGIPDEINPQTGEFNNREVDKELMKSVATEARLIHNFITGNISNTVAAGVRFAVAGFDRKEEAVGTNGSDFNLTILGDYEEKFHFTTTNLSLFAEDCIKIANRFSVTPGIRFESLESEAEAEVEANGIEKETETEKSRSFVLLGFGLQYKISNEASLYGNISQSYRPVDYAQLVPLGNISKVDSNMKDPRGLNTDLGIRGSVQNFFNYDVSIFYLGYNNRIGLVSKTDENNMPYTLRTNTDKSIHKGIESYLELNITKAMQCSKKIGIISIYNSFAYTNARYTKGIFKGNQVEYAPEIINRTGITYSKKMLTTSIQISNQSGAFGDAANTVRSINPIVGRIPGYSVMDWSVSVSVKKMKFRGGINNIGDSKYFTQRTDEYPGPGIIPSAGRSFYIGFGYNL